jgi:hypothetical protein
LFWNDSLDWVLMSDYFQFSSVFIKKIIKPKVFLKKPKLVQTNRFQFGSDFRTKTSSNRFDSVFSGFFGLGSVWFFRFYAYKTETEPADFFKILIFFFLRFSFFSYFFNFLNFF